MNFVPTPENEITPIYKKKYFLPIISAATVIILALITFLIFYLISGSNNTSVGADDENISSEETVSPVINADTEMRGVWIATVSNINFPSKQGLSEKQLKAELDSIVETTSQAGLNAIFFQVMPVSDALYESEIYPYSEFVSGKQGKAPSGNFDPLAYITEKAHEYGIELHAWMNPFRVTETSAKSLEDLCDSHPAVLDSSIVVKYTDGKYYYNPGLPKVREMIAGEAAYIVEKYKVDGIHIDDYFYPYPVENGVFDDGAVYEAHGGNMSLGDWRRQNVNLTVKAIHDAVKEKNTECDFGVSPFGIYANSGSDTPVKGSETSGLEAYLSLYCDAVTWAKEGYVDYLAPQLYWSFGTKAAPFDTVAKWWNAILDGTGVKLYAGHALYKIEDFPENEIPIQVEFCRSLLCCEGNMFYGYDMLKKNTLGIKDKLASMYSDIDASSGNTEKSNVAAINYPQNGYKTTASSQYMLGSSDPSTPLTLNGEPISRTKSGYFSFYATLASGTNSYSLVQGNSTLSHSVTKAPQVAAATQIMDSFDIISMSPGEETWISGGDTVTFTCTAPAQSTVTARVGGVTVSLKPTGNNKNSGKNYVAETYSGSVKFSSMAKDGEIIDLGTITYTAKNGSNEVTKRVGLMKQIGKGALIYAQVDKDYTYLKKSTTSSFYDDYTPTSPGMRDYITGFSSGYYKLRFGGYVSSEDVSVVEGQPLFENSVITAESEVIESENQNYKDNYTELRFGVLENVPVDVWVDGKEVTIVLYDTLPEIMPKMNLVSNPLFDSVSVKAGASGKTVLYTAMLKDADNYYGFNLEYDSSFIRIKFNNPITSYEGEKPLSGKVIYVDAGHGGADIGARGPGAPEQKLFESNLNLLIANSLVDKLEALGATVYTTRTTDVTHDLYARLDMISEVVPDILVSVHHNSVADSVNASKARGYLGLYSNNSGILLAKTVSDTICDSLNRYQRATAYQKLAVARDHRFPSTLCEMSFISNIEEFQWTIAEGNIDRSAQAVCDGVLNFF